jgi:hypothetical protein
MGAAQALQQLNPGPSGRGFFITPPKVGGQTFAKNLRLTSRAPVPQGTLYPHDLPWSAPIWPGFFAVGCGQAIVELANRRASMVSEQASPAPAAWQIVASRTMAAGSDEGAMLNAKEKEHRPETMP